MDRLAKEVYVKDKTFEDKRFSLGRVNKSFKTHGEVLEIRLGYDNRPGGNPIKVAFEDGYTLNMRSGEYLYI